MVDGMQVSSIAKQDISWVNAVRPLSVVVITAT
jgi:hypothetical protein